LSIFSLKNIYKNCCESLVADLINNRNRLIAFFGTKSSGKKFLLIGNKGVRSIGLTQYAIKDLFNLIGIQKVRSNENRVYISHYCVYENIVYDLFSDETQFELSLYKDEDEHFFHLAYLT